MSKVIYLYLTVNLRQRMVWSCLPVTPFHYPVAYVLYKLKANFSLPALIVGSMAPDLEIPFIVLLLGTEVPHRLVLHSLLGAATLGTLISIAITVLVYPRLTSAIFPIDKQKVKEKCTFSLGLAVSCLLGILSMYCWMSQTIPTTQFSGLSSP